jgi:hypothetical protein
MAAAFGAFIGAATEVASGDNSIVVTTSATASVGERIVVHIGYFEAAATISSVTDSAGNTYAVEITANQSSTRAAVATAHVTTQLASSGTITVTFSNTDPIWRNAVAHTVTGVASSSYTDGTGTEENAAADAAWDTSDTTTTVADAIIVGCCTFRDPTNRTHTPATNITEVNPEQVVANHNFVAVYRVLTATGTYDVGGTWSGTDFAHSAAVHVVLKGDTGPPPPAPKIRVIQSTLRW